MMEFSDQVTVPDRCIRCVALGRIAGIYGVMAESIRRLEADAKSGKALDDFADHLVQEGTMPRDKAIQLANQRRDDINAKLRSTFERMDEVRQAQVEIGRRVVSHCELGEQVTVVEREGIGTTFGRCMSTVRERFDVPNAEIVRVEHRPIVPPES